MFLFHSSLIIRGRDKCDLDPIPTFHSHLSHRYILLRCISSLNAGGLSHQLVYWGLHVQGSPIAKYQFEEPVDKDAERIGVRYLQPGKTVTAVQEI